MIRSSPCFLPPEALRNIDALFRQFLTETLNVQLDDKAWRQASLPVKAGCLGVRRIEELALPAYLSSSSAAEALVLQIAPSAAEPFGLLFSAALEAWSATAGNEVDPPIQPSASLQSSWDTPLVTHALKNLLSSASDQDDLRLRSVSAKDVGGGEWLEAYPSIVCGTLLTDEEIQIAAGLRIVAPIVSPHLCVDCGAAVTASGTHGLSCLKSRCRFPRHKNMKEIVGRALRSAGLPTRLEPLSLCRGTNNKIPDGETLVPWQSGQPLALDVTCIANIVLATFSSCNPHIKTILILRQFSLTLIVCRCMVMLCGTLLVNNLTLWKFIELCYYLIVLPQEIVGLNLTSFENLHA